jgi:hypothetical protein
VGADFPLDCLDREGIIKCTVLPPKKLSFSSSVEKQLKLMFPLCSAPADTMYQDYCTQFDEEECIVGTWVVAEVCKAVEMGCGLVDVDEVWEYSITRYDKGSNSEGLFQSTLTCS